MKIGCLMRAIHASSSTGLRLGVVVWGRYRTGDGGMINVTRRENELRAEGLGDEALVLTAESDTAFRVPARGGRVTFLWDRE